MAEIPWEIRHWRIVTLLELLEGHAESFWSVAATVGQAIVHLQYGGISDNSAAYIGGALGTLNKAADQLRLSSVAKHCRRISDYVNNGEESVRLDRLREMLVDILTRTSDDLADRVFLVVPPESVELYRQPSPPFGTAVSDAFPHATEDISEAGKCLALNRPTAAVFHLMRAMECAVQALAIKLTIPKPERVWGMLLSDIGTKIKDMPKGPGRTKWSEAHSHLYHVKEAWRNDTMHPKQTYTFEEAKAVFDAVRVFMNALAALV
jgi:hypothetical protein